MAPDFTGFDHQFFSEVKRKTMFNFECINSEDVNHKTQTYNVILELKLQWGVLKVINGYCSNYFVFMLSSRSWSHYLRKDARETNAKNMKKQKEADHPSRR